MPSVPAGFERTKYERTLSYDKCRLDFTVVDEQYPSGNYPQKNMVKAEASHTVSSPGPAFNPWSGAFDGTYEYARGINPGLGFAAFQAWCLDRLDALAKEGKGPDGKPPVIIPTQLTMIEPSVYGRGVGKFRLAYSYTLATEVLISSAVKASGLWKPVVNQPYDLWASSMKDLNVWSPRGYAGLKFNNNDDIILDICSQRTDAVTPHPGKGNPGTPPEPNVPKLNIITPPPKDSSFLEYQLEFMMRPRHATTELKPLPMEPANISVPQVKVDADDGYRPPYQNSNPSVIQVRNNPSVVLSLRGWAVRAGWTITPPQLKSLAGMTPAPAPGGRDYVRTRVTGNCFGVPIVFCRGR